MIEPTKAARYREAAELVEKQLDEESRERAFRLLLPLLDDDPNDPHALFLIGHVFMRSDKPGLAYQMLKRGTEIAPHEHSMWHNLGKCAYESLRSEEAELHFRRALKLKPDSAISLDGLGMIGLNRCDYDMAREYCRRALALDPTLMESTVNLGMCNLAARNWREGWPGYNANLGLDGNRKKLVYGKEKDWDGTQGATVICYGEQGIGDEISFASCLPDLIRDCKKVVIDTDGRLKRLFRRSFPGAEVYGNRYQLEPQPWHAKNEFDYRVALGQLPQFYRNADAEFPGTPYLVPNPEMALQWRALFDALGPEPKIGIGWTGGARHTGRNRRSVTLETLLPVLKQPCHWVSLQYQDAADEIETFEAIHGIRIHHWQHGVQIFDYDVTAALISELDLVISVTTTAIHTAGALGKECWCLVPERPIWRYGGKNSDFPWAKSVTLHRQKGGQWPVHILAGMLKDRLNDFGSGRREAAVS